MSIESPSGVSHGGHKDLVLLPGCNENRWFGRQDCLRLVAVDWRATHTHRIVATKFSPNGRLLATATWGVHSLRIYDCHAGGDLLVDLPTRVGLFLNQSLVWLNDSERLFATAISTVLRCPLEPYSLDGPSTATINPGALPWHATVGSSQPLPTLQCHGWDMHHNARANRVCHREQ